MALFTDKIINFVSNPKVSFKKLLGLVSEFTKVSGHKVNIQKNQLHFYILVKQQYGILMDKFNKNV